MKLAHPLFRPTAMRTLAVGVVLFVVIALKPSFAQVPATNPDPGVAGAGRVLMAIGDVRATRGGQARALAKGAIVDQGDLISTGVSSNAQVRMIDGAVIALRAQSEFRIDEYNFNGKEDGTEKATMSLLKGGVRAVTGVIGHQNQDNLKVNAVVATIGIRGTGFNLNYCVGNCQNVDRTLAKDGLYAGVFEGKISLRNDTGTEIVGTNQFYYVADRNTPPTKLLQPPNFLPDPLTGQRVTGRTREVTAIPTISAPVNVPPAAAADQVVLPPVTSLPTVGQVVVTAPPVAAPGNNSIAPATFFNTTVQGDGAAPPNAAGNSFYLQKAETYPAGTLGADGFPPHSILPDSNPSAGPASPNGFAIATSGSGSSAYVSQISLQNPPYVIGGTKIPVVYAIGSAQQMEGGSYSGIVSWGRWANGDVQQLAGYNSGNPINIPSWSGFHYIVGEQTTAANMNALAANGAILNFALLGATTPTPVANQAGTWLVTSGNMTANFASAAINGNLGLYSSQSGGYGVFNMAFSGGLSPSSPSNAVTTTVTKSAGGLTTCSGGCGGTGNVAFYGNATPAQAAGLSYNFTTNSNLVQGVAVFKR